MTLLILLFTICYLCSKNVNERVNCHYIGKYWGTAHLYVICNIKKVAIYPALKLSGYDNHLLLLKITEKMKSDFLCATFF